MIVNGQVCFVSQDPLGGEQVISIEEDLFRVLLVQARSLEQLRTLWFGFGIRKTASMTRHEAKVKAAGA